MAEDLRLRENCPQKALDLYYIKQNAYMKDVYHVEKRQLPIPPWARTERNYDSVAFPLLVLVT